MKHTLLDALAYISLAAATGMITLGWFHHDFLLQGIGWFCLIPGYSRLTRRVL